MKKHSILIYIYLLLPLSLLAVPSISMGQTMSEDLLQERTKEVAKTLRCAVCQSESVWESNAELALQMREIIRERLIQGQSPKEIQDYFVSRYGDFILLKPRVLGLNWLLWVGPFVLLAGGGILLYRTLRKWIRQTAPAAPEALLPVDERSRQRIDQELRSLNK